MNTWTYSINGSTCSITVPAVIASIPLTSFPRLIELINENKVVQYGATWNPSDFTLTFSEDGVVLTPGRVIGGQNYDGSNWYYETHMNGSILYINEFTREYSSGYGTNTEYGFIRVENVYCTRNTGVQNYRTYNTDNVIRTLMPYEVYAFYVHYVRKDGSYTNGIPLENKVNISGDLATDIYRQIKDIASDPDGSEKLASYNLTDIATIKEIEDKYLYELFIRDYAYSKEYFGVYLDNKGKKLFRTNSGIVNINGNVYVLRLGVRFEHITYPPGYVGAFFSYEKLNPLSVYQGYVSDNLLENSNIIVKANDVEAANIRYDGSLFIPHHKITNNGIESIAAEPYYSYVNNASPILSNAAITFEGATIDRTGTHGGIAMNLAKKDTGVALNDLYQPAVGIVGSIIVFNTSIFSNEVKELIQFGPVSVKPLNYDGINVFGSYGEESNAVVESSIIDINDNIINYDMNYPSFLVQDKILTYKDKIFINEELKINKITGHTIDSTQYFDQDNYAKVTTVWKFSNLNLLALSIKKEPENASGVIDNDKNTVNTLVRPVNASDLFKLESCYIPEIHKALTNYNKNLQVSSTYTNLIRCSYPIRNESGINSWRIFDPTKYYVIDNSNGEIVHIFGAGSSFFVHTKNNLLVTSSDGKITADNSIIHLQENNVFDIPPVEIFTSELGYGGLKYQKCQLLSQFGYIWYDTDRRKLFRWDAGKLIDINSGIDEIIKKYQFEYCYINIDNNSNRIFFCFVKDSNTQIITIAYNTLHNKWLSIYDFKYDMSIHTANVVLFAIRDAYNIYSYGSSVTPCNYAMLQSVNSDLPSYIDSQSSSPTRYFCFDVIFNNAYTIPKVLDSISWVHEIIQQHILNPNHPAEIRLEYDNIDTRVHDIDGLNLIVYSDAVDSGVLELQHDNLNDVANPSNPNAYKYPYFNKGVWNLSYFRNAIITPVTDTELNALVAKYGQDTVNKLKKAYKAIDRNGVPVYRSSDMRSLIYGKYIAVRFIFKTVKRVKFDNLEFNLQKY